MTITPKRKERLCQFLAVMTIGLAGYAVGNIGAKIAQAAFG